MDNTENNTREPMISEPSFFSGLSCKSFIAYATLLFLLFMGAHLLGFREHTGMLSGTDSPDEYHLYFGAIYIILYASFVVIAPILLIASLLIEIREFFKRKNGG